MAKRNIAVGWIKEVSGDSFERGRRLFGSDGVTRARIHRGILRARVSDGVTRVVG